MGKRTKLKSNYRKRSKRTRKYSFKKRKTTRKRRKQKGGADTPEQQLLKASYNGGKDIVRKLLEQGAKINTVDKNGNTPLHLASVKGHLASASASVKGHIDIVTELLSKKGVKIDEKNINGYTSLHFASRDGKKEIVKLLLENNAKVNLVDNHHDIPLHLASMNGYTEIVKLLIDEATIDSQNIKGDTPLHEASWKGHTDTVNLLIDNEAKIDSQNNEGNTPLHEASWEGHTDTVNLLIDNKAKIDLQNNEGNTPLHEASENGHYETVKALLNRGADINFINDKEINEPSALLKKKNPLALAIISKNVDLIELLLTRGAKPDIINDCINQDNSIFDMAPVTIQDLINKVALLGPPSTSIVLRQQLHKPFLKKSQADKLHDLIQDDKEAAITFLQSHDLNIDTININVRYANGQTILIKAIQKGYYQAAEKILDLSQKLELDVTVIDKKGKNALDYAIEQHLNSDNDNFLNIIKELIKKGSVFDTIEKYGKYQSNPRYQALLKIKPLINLSNL